MIPKEQKRINQQIESYLKGNLNSEGCRELLNWLNNDPRNKKHFIEYSRNWNASRINSTEASWQILLQKRQLREQSSELQIPWNQGSQPGRRVSLWRKVSKYAAFLALGIISTLLISHWLKVDHKMITQNQWVQLETKAGQKTKVVLSDSSVIWLNSESVLTFPGEFGKHKNRVIRLEGEAYFDVTHRRGSKFTVQCDDYSIEVEGTKFNVMAYKDFRRTETTLVEGAVNIIRGTQKLSLEPGERAIWSGNTLAKSKAQIRQATLWKDNKFYFDNVPFKELVRRLERWYDVKITLKDTTLNDIYYSGYFKNEETVWQVLDVIKLTTPIVYERNQFREIIIKANPDEVGGIARKTD